MRRKSITRHNNTLKRKNFLPTLIVTILLWGLTGALIYFVDPSYFGALPAFFLLVFTGTLFTTSLLFASSRRGLIASASVTVFLILAYLGIGNVLNLILIIAIAVSTELYFSLR